MKQLFFPLLWLLILRVSSSQDFVFDSIEDRLEKTDLQDSLVFEEIVNEIWDLESSANQKAELLMKLGSHLVSTYQYEKADQVLAKCLEIAEDREVIAEANYQTGLSLMYRDIRLRSLRYFHAALDDFTLRNDSLCMGKTLDKIADNHNYIGEHKTARPFYNRALKIFTDLNDTTRLTNVLGNIGGMLSEEGDNDSSLVYYQRAIALDENAGNLSNLSSDLSGVAIALEALGRTREALRYYHRSYNVSQQSGDPVDLAFANQHLGYFHFNNGDYDSAQYYMEITNAYGNEMNYAQLMLNSLDVLHETAREKGEYKRAYDLFSQVKILEDSLLSLENVSLINSLQSAYEMDRQEAENRLLLEQAMLRERVINEQSKLNTTLIFSAILLIIGTIALIGLNRTRKRKNEIIEQDRDLIREQAKRLKELDDFKSTFFANISHDIRAPVSLIKGFIDLLKMSEPNLKKESKEYLAHMEDTIQRLGTMTDEINQLIQLEENKYRLTYTDLDINEFFGTLGKMFRTGNQGKPIEFEYKSEVRPGQILQVDKAALEKIIFNVVGNAFKYNMTGSMVGLHISESQNDLIIKVKDDGPGIQSDKLEKVFDRYYRTERGSKAALGQGIGLSLAKDLVELHGGQMKATSVPNEETCFEIILPINGSKKDE